MQLRTDADASAAASAEAALCAAEKALFEEKERTRVTLDAIGDAVMTTDRSGRVTCLNALAETMTGWSVAQALGRPFDEVFRVIDAETRRPAANPAQRAIAENRTVALAANCLLLGRDGGELAIEDSATPLHGRDGEVIGAVIVFHDVSASSAMVLKMAHLAQHDFLTGLPNRMLLNERLSRAIGLARRHSRQIGLLFLDLDNFKCVNDAFGHCVGDRLLQSVAARLSDCVRAIDTVCRQGGDEFVILLVETEQPQGAAHVAEKLLTAFVAPHDIDGHELRVSFSIGISIYPDDGLDVDTLLRHADTAMYDAKANGRSNYQFFKAETNAPEVGRLLVENSLRRA